MREILRLEEAMMRYGIWPLTAMALMISLGAQAQLGPSPAYPINAASPKRPVMLIDQKDRSVVVEVIVGADGRTVSTRLVTHSDSGVYDERVRGFWKDQPFVPALDAQGRPKEQTLRIRNDYSFRPVFDNTATFRTGERYNHRVTIEGKKPVEIAERIGRMKCRDFLWEYDYMKRRARKRVSLEHEELFHVAFAMLIAERNLPAESRDALIKQWTALTTQTVDSCRAQPDAMYWKDAFMHTFDSATPVSVKVP